MANSVVDKQNEVKLVPYEGDHMAVAPRAEDEFTQYVVTSAEGTHSDEGTKSVEDNNDDRVCAPKRRGTSDWNSKA